MWKTDKHANLTPDAKATKKRVILPHRPTFADRYLTTTI